MKFLFYYSVLAIAVTHGATAIASATKHDEVAAGVARTTGGGNLRSSGAAATAAGNNNSNNLNVFQERQLSSDTCKPCEVHSDCRIHIGHIVMYINNAKILELTKTTYQYMELKMDANVVILLKTMINV